MASEVMCMFLRVAAGARPSSIDMSAVDELIGEADSVKLMSDIRDSSVFFFPLPDEADEIMARRIISDLVQQPHIDEVWGSSIPAARVLNGSATQQAPLE